MGLILDSSVLIAAERNKLDLERFFLSLSGESFFMSSITLSELWHGCHRGKGSARQERLNYVQHLEATLPVLEFATKEAVVHAKIWAELEEKGQKIGPHDFIIAATALANDFAVATLNENEFKRISNLRLISIKSYLFKL
jgi:tRNA(fMet)-specific endonuclease VapC